MAGIVPWLAIFSVVLVAGAGPSNNNGSTAINIVNMSHLSNLTLPDVLNNTTATAIIINSTVIVPGVIPAGVGNNIDTTSPTTTAIYMQKETILSILKIIIPSIVSFAGVALMVFLWWSSSKAKLAGVDELPPIASLIADPTSSAIAPSVELVNRSTQNQPPPPPPPAMAGAGRGNTKKQLNN